MVEDLTVEAIELMRDARAWTAALLLAAAVSATSCGVFDTREPNPPGGGGSTPRESPINADAVLFNYRMALEYGDQSQYEEALSDDFKFIPDEVDRDYFKSITNTDIFLGWGTDEELTAIRRVTSDSESLTASFEIDTHDEWADSALIRLYYTFRQTIVREGLEDSVAVFKGFAAIHLVPDNSGFWSIDKWTDTATPPSLTWGWLKGSTVAAPTASLGPGAPAGTDDGASMRSRASALTEYIGVWYNTAGARGTASTGSRAPAAGPRWRNSK
jgi:hypothetical protein